MANASSKTKKPKKNAFHRVSHAHEPRSRFIKRVSTYTFFAILTVILSVLVFYRAKGYTFTKTGQVEKRGIVLINSAPVSSRISIDGKDIGKKTDYKLEISEGSHSLKLEAEGYRTWQTNFTIRSEQVEWFYYPYLIPNEINQEVIQTGIAPKTYSNLSPDNEIVAVSKSGAGQNQAFNLELLQLKDQNPIATAKQIVIPSQLFSRQEDGTLGTATFGNWSPNGDSIFLEHTYSGKKEIINLRVNAPEESKNISGISDSAIADYEYDDSSRLHLLNNGELAIYDPKTLNKETVVDTSVLSFDVFQDSKHVFTKASGSVDGPSLDIVIKDGQNESKKVTNLKGATAQDLDFQYTTNRRTNYLSISNQAQKELLIYKNPLEPSGVLEPLFLSTFSTLQSKQIQQSPPGSTQPGSYITLQLSPSSIFVYNFESEKSISYDLGVTVPEINITGLAWIDSERLQARTNEGKIYYLDYDGNYTNLITSTDQPFSFFVRGEDKTVVINTAEGKQTISQIKFKK